jgi:hypothetical protein
MSNQQKRLYSSDFYFTKDFYAGIYDFVGNNVDTASSVCVPT